MTTQIVAKMMMRKNDQRVMSRDGYVHSYR